MAEREHPQEPAPERDDRHDEPYGIAASRLGLQSPLRLPEAYPEGIGDREAELVAQVPEHDLDRAAPKKWPEDY